MSELISGKEAFDAAYNGGEAQWRWAGKEVEWRELKGETAFSINELKGGVCEFRLKPRTVNLNGVEVPAPFEPKFKDGFYYLDGAHAEGFSWRKMHDDTPPWFFENPVWRTESDIKQVVAALRSIFKPQ